MKYVIIFLLSFVLWTGSFIYFKIENPEWATGNNGPGNVYQNTYWPLRYLCAKWSEPIIAKRQTFHFEDFNVGSGWMHLSYKSNYIKVGANEDIVPNKIKAGDVVFVKISRILETWDDFEDKFQYSADAITLLPQVNSF